MIADPKAGIATVKARDGIINEALELRRLQLRLDATVLTPDAKAEGFGNVDGAAPGLMASQVSDAFGTKERINPNAVWNGTLLPQRGRAQHLRGGEEVGPAARAGWEALRVSAGRMAQLEHQPGGAQRLACIENRA